LGRTREAITEYLEALRLRPDFPIAENNLHVALSALQHGGATTASTAP
jgi:hypothetical protein